MMFMHFFSPQSFPNRTAHKLIKLLCWLLIWLFACDVDAIFWLWNLTYFEAYRSLCNPIEPILARQHLCITICYRSAHRLKLIFACMMEVSKFPLDYQVCTMEIGSCKCSHSPHVTRYNYINVTVTSSICLPVTVACKSRHSFSRECQLQKYNQIC